MQTVNLTTLPLSFRGNNEEFSGSTEVNENNGVLRFNQVTGEEQGQYICTATNEVGSITATATLEIAGEGEVKKK